MSSRSRSVSIENYQILNSGPLPNDFNAAEPRIPGNILHVEDLFDRHTGSTSHRRRKSGTARPEVDGEEGEETSLLIDESPKVDPKSLWQKFRTPSPWWIIPGIALAALFMAMTTAPKTEIYIHLACVAQRGDREVVPPLYFPHPHFGKPTSPGIHNSNNSTGVTQFGNIGNGTTLPQPPISCSADPDVQAAAAKMATVLATTNGVLSCLTTAWWSKLSDSYGRIRVLSVATIGILVVDASYIAAVLAPSRLSYPIILLGPIFDGGLGGFATASAAVHAYISDCVEPSARSRIFSLYMGFLFIGLALGPVAGGLLVKYTEDLLSVFYFAGFGHLIFVLSIFFILPESLSEESRAKNIEERRQREEEDRSSLKPIPRYKKIFAFLSPLTIFLPREREVGERGRGKDWNLTLIAGAYAVNFLLVGSYQYKFQYAAKVYAWGSEKLGYWLTVVGVVRALHLILVLPLLIRLFRPTAAPAIPSTEPSEHDSHDKHHEKLVNHHATTFDLEIVRWSLLFDVFCFLLIILVSSEHAFFAVSVLNSLGAGFGPAIQSLAVGLVKGGKKEAGALFGGMGVAQALTSSIIGPAIFGITFINTVATFPKAIFLVSTCFLTSALVLVSLVKLPQQPVWNIDEEDRRDRIDTSTSLES